MISIQEKPSVQPTLTRFYVIEIWKNKLVSKFWFSERNLRRVTILMVRNILKVISKYPSLKKKKNRIGLYLLTFPVCINRDCTAFESIRGHFGELFLSSFCAITSENPKSRIQSKNKQHPPKTKSIHLQSSVYCFSILNTNSVPKSMKVHDFIHTVSSQQS